MTKEPTIDELLTKTNETFETLYVAYRDDFVRYSKKFSIKEDIAVDIYQETFISFYQNLLSGKLTQLTSSIKTYIFGIGKFKIYEHLRVDSKLKIIDEPLRSDITEDLDLDSQVLNEREQLVKKQFKKLGQQCQEILELFYLQGRSISEIQVFKEYESTDVVKSLKWRCLKKLKQLVNA